MHTCKLTSFDEQAVADLKKYLNEGGRFIQLSPGLPKGKLPFAVPDDVTIIDMRYGGVNFITGNHPRLEGYWTQYSHLDTGLARNFTFSHVITDDTPIENWKSEPHEMQRAPIGALASEEYRHAHNHFQLLHSEIYNFSKDLNGVAVWGDSAALVPEAKSWGAFFSARSWPLKWTGYTPEKLFDYQEKDFDAALVGVEIDVLNAGRDWNSTEHLETGAPQMAKVGLQIVGFGNKNTAGIELRTEDSDDPARSPAERRGAWHWGIIMRNALGSESTVLFSENGHIRRGIDFEQTTFREGALRITGNGPMSGIVFDQGSAGEVYSDPTSGSLNIRIGHKGLRIWNPSGTLLLMEITNDGVRIVRSYSIWRATLKKIRRFFWGIAKKG